MECKQAIESADVVFALAFDPAGMFMLERLARDVRDLQSCYRPARARVSIYEEMVETVLAEVRAGKHVCFALYGHPGVFALPSHTALSRARAEGFDATMLPGISAEDSLFADLGLDPATNGCQSFEATDFLIHERQWDPTSLLVLWQVAVVGITDLPEPEELAPGHSWLTARLVEAYGAEHTGILYEASPYPLCQPRIERVPLHQMGPELFRPHTTLVIEPLAGSVRVNRAFEAVIVRRNSGF